MIAADIMLAASEHYRAGRIADAVQLYKRVLQQHPDHPQANANLGLVSNRSGRYEVALPYFSTAIHNAPAVPSFRIAHARTLLALGRVLDTIAAVERAHDDGHTELPELEVLKARAVSLTPLTGVDGIAQVPKVFCIGRNKTGTTSLEAVFALLGFRLGNLFAGQRLISAWGRRDFKPITDFCLTASAFQDIPFSLSFTYQALDQAYPSSKFILTVRESPDEWFQSLTRFHTKIVGKGRLPTAADLQEFANGWLWRTQQLILGIDAQTLYSPEIYKAHYLAHNGQVVDYFRHRPADLLVINLGDKDAMERLCSFLGFSGGGLKIPHLNRSR